MGIPGVLSLVLICGLLAAPRGGEPPGRVQNVCPPWAPQTDYKVGDLVSYLGVTYSCIKAHTSSPGREPSAAPDLWRVFCGAEAELPAVPQGLAALADGPARIVVSWSLVQGASGYELQADRANLGGVTSPFLHKNLAAGSTHTYRVRAVNEAGTSPWSEPVTCATEPR